MGQEFVGDSSQAGVGRVANERGDGQVVEHVRERLPHHGAAEFALALRVEAVDLTSFFPRLRCGVRELKRT